MLLGLLSRPLFWEGEDTHGRTYGRGHWSVLALQAAQDSQMDKELQGRRSFPYPADILSASFPQRGSATTRTPGLEQVCYGCSRRMCENILFQLEMRSN